MLEQQLFNALSLGCVYALFALGFTLVFGVLGVINLSHGAVFMVGAYAALQAVTRLELPLWASLLFAFAFSGLLGLLIDAAVLKPLRARNAPHLIPMIATIGLAIAINSLVQGIFGLSHGGLFGSVGEVVGHEHGRYFRHAHRHVRVAEERRDEGLISRGGRLREIL